MQATGDKVGHWREPDREGLGPRRSVLTASRPLQGPATRRLYVPLNIPHL